MTECSVYINCRRQISRPFPEHRLTVEWRLVIGDTELFYPLIITITMVDFTVTRCDLVDIIMEIIRFLSHITILHLLNYSIDNKEQLFETNYLKVMLFTALAIIIYQIFVKKVFRDKFKKMKYICDDDN